VGSVLVECDPADTIRVRDRIASDLLGRAVDPGSVGDVLLVVSELVSNAVLHAASRSDVDWVLHDRGAESAVVVRVGDGSDRLPVPRDVDDRDTSGRGLAIVDAIATEWGVDRTASGKAVWARVPVSTAA